jgi:3-hydroxyisobutyrate dehydrogenase-like beta-hydroxyacid dehydrogenase
VGDLRHATDVSYVTGPGDDARVSRVAVLGLGAMGSRIARRLLQAGHELVVWNRTPSKAQPLLDAGAAPAATPAEAAGQAEAVITMVADPKALRAVVEGADGIASGVHARTTAIEMSTVGPATIAWLRSVLPDDVSLLDAPVLGSLGEAEGGTLQVFIGGPERVAARWTPLLDALGTPMHVGPLGTGAAAKLVANATLVGTMTLLGETLALADAFGMPREVAFRVLAMTPLAAQAERRREPLETDEFPRRFDLSLGRKDAGLIVDEGGRVGVDLRVLRAAAEWFAEAERAGLGGRDYSEVLKHILDRD